MKIIQIHILILLLFVDDSILYSISFILAKKYRSRNATSLYEVTGFQIKISIKGSLTLQQVTFKGKAT